MCQLYEIIYSLVPWNRFRSWLIRFHFDRCPHCQQKTAGDEVIRPLLAKWEGVEESISPVVLHRLDNPDSFRRQRQAIHSVKTWAIWGTLTASLLTTAWIALLRSQSQPFHPIAGQPVESSPPTFTLVSALIAEENARTYIFQAEDPRLVVVWFEGV